jgi:suppressor for copper-sensitivity B
MLKFKLNFSINKIIIFIIFLISNFGLLNQAFSAITSFQKTNNQVIDTRILISYDSQIDKFQKYKIIGAIHFKIEDGWKIYGKDSDGIGLPPSLNFNDSNNYLSHQIYWPQAKIAEEQIGKEKIKYSYYQNEVIIPFELILSSINLNNQLNLKLSFAYCKDVCIPADQEFKLFFNNKVDQKVIDEIYKVDPKLISNQLLESNKNNNIEQQTIKTGNNYSLMLIITFALIGGAILNIMPCVLPVLSIKLMSIINHANASQQKIRFAFLSTLLGILSCFIVIALIAISLKSIGQTLGWGLQFQNPYFLIFIVIILIFFTAQFLDVITLNFNQIIATVLNQKIDQHEQKKNIFIPNFLSGILAVMLATPCSAPFLGSAISFALLSDWLNILIIFISIGLGFGLPYILLLISPKIIQKLPKPGSWMFKFKQVMAGFLMATVIWLIYILSNNIGTIPAFIIAFLSIAIFATLSFRGIIKKVILLISLIFLCFTLPFAYQQKQIDNLANYDSLWLEFDEEAIEYLIDDNKIVLVDITADWCLTCKFNKIRVLKDPEIINKLKSKEIIGLRADITKPDPLIMNYLHKFNRFGIPFNAVYGPNARDGIVTSELLSKEELLIAIKNAKEI